MQIPNSCQDATFSDGLGPTSSSYTLFQESRFIDSDRSNVTQTATGNIKTSKPRIWSLAEMASKEDKDCKRSHPLNNKYYPMIGRQPFFNNQIQYPISIKPDRTTLDIYQHINYPAKLDGAAPKEYALIESYHRALAAHNNIQSDSQAFVILPNQMERTVDRGVSSNAGLTNISIQASPNERQSPKNVNKESNMIE